jgi:hypothetical protein
MHKCRFSSSNAFEPLTSLGNRVPERRRPKSRKAPLPTSPPASLTVIVLGCQTVSDPQITEGKRANADTDRRWRCRYNIGEAIQYMNLLRTSTWAGAGWIAVAISRTRISSSGGRSSRYIAHTSNRLQPRVFAPWPALGQIGNRRYHSNFSTMYCKVMTTVLDWSVNVIWGARTSRFLHQSDGVDTWIFVG